ncbi:MAG: hypothetical protein ACI38Y_04025 [Candidatus Methanomethylophilaceae archaeon]
MTLVVCTCPHCGGEVRMDDSLATGCCTYCGRQILNDKAVVGNISVRMDHRSELINTLKLAKYAMYDGDAPLAVSLVNKAMQIDPENSDVWYMDAVIDRRNADNDILRARQYPSLGIFTEDEVSVYRNYDGSSGQMLFTMAVIFSFFAIFVSITVGVVFELYYLILGVFVIGMEAIVLTHHNMRGKKPHIPRPVFRDEEDAVRSVSYEETKRRMEGN